MSNKSFSVNSKSKLVDKETYKSKFLSEIESSYTFAPAVQATLRGVFDDFDRDKDGHLNHLEFASLLKGLYNLSNEYFIHRKRKSD